MRKILFFLFVIAHLQDGKTSDTGPEFIFRLRTNDVKMGKLPPISFKATVHVQKFIDQTLRVQMNHPEFAENDHPFHTPPKIVEKLTEPFLVLMKMGQMKSFYVGTDDSLPSTLILNFKRLVLTHLGIGRQLEGSNGIRYENSIYGDCSISLNSSLLSNVKAKELEGNWITEEERDGLVPSLEGRHVCYIQTYGEFYTKMNLNECKPKSALEEDIVSEFASARDMQSHYQETRMYRCGPVHSPSQSNLENFYENSVIRKVVVDQFKKGTKKTIAEIELMGVKKYTKDTMLKNPSPSKKVVSLMFETVQDFGSFMSLKRQVHNSVSSASEITQEEGCPFANPAQRNVKLEMNRDEEFADPETTTPHGCTCISLCESSIGADNYRYDWCKTSDKCGEYTYAGFYYWDKCQYLTSSRPEFTSLSWDDKHAQTWSSINSDAAVGPYPSPPGIFTESVKTSFDNEWDEMPAGRQKYIHSVGAVCPFVVKIKDSPFTGVFQSGESHGMIRLGSAAPIKKGAGMTPGGGVKFFRSGKHSADFVLLNQLGPIADENHNFFAVPLSNHLPEDAPLALAPLTLKFCQAQSCPTKVGLSDASTYDQNGNEVDNVVFPFKVNFVPTGDINFDEEFLELADFNKQFTDLPVGTVLYKLRGHQSPDDKDGVLLGDVVTTDKCVTSHYGDTKLFFKHQYIDEDKNLKPEWADGYDFECTPYCVIPP